MAVAAEALWKHKPTKPISSKVPYYLFVFFFLLVVMSIVLLAETQGLLQQQQNDLVIWSEAHQEKWATNDHDCSPNHYTKKNLTPHTQPEPGLPGGQSIFRFIVYISTRDHCCEYTDIFPFSPLLFIFSITFLISFDLII